MLYTLTKQTVLNTLCVIQPVLLQYRLVPSEDFSAVPSAPNANNNTGLASPGTSPGTSPGDSANRSPGNINSGGNSGNSYIDELLARGQRFERERMMKVARTDGRSD